MLAFSCMMLVNRQPMLAIGPMVPSLLCPLSSSNNTTMARQFERHSYKRCFQRHGLSRKTLFSCRSALEPTAQLDSPDAESTPNVKFSRIHSPHFPSSLGLIAKALHPGVAGSTPSPADRLCAGLPGLALGRCLEGRPLESSHPRMQQKPGKPLVQVANLKGNICP